MVMPPDIAAQILRYYHAEKWTVGTIARQLHVHHSVVRRVLAQAGLHDGFVFRAHRSITSPEAFAKRTFRPSSSILKPTRVALPDLGSLCATFDT